MTKHGWMLWLAPVAVWGVYMCWLSGYQSGYDQGHCEGWDTARASFMPATASLDSPYLSTAFGSQRPLELTQ